ncbi:MAG: hypothetical protein GPOALKHO_001958 [Sodalis sp.]|nr:MAG: hypothetical protein GPOALKHO_001958 [Sodalis sp.]
MSHSPAITPQPRPPANTLVGESTVIAILLADMPRHYHLQSLSVGMAPASIIASCLRAEMDHQSLLCQSVQGATYFRSAAAITLF